MIAAYQQEIKEQKYRLYEMEFQEVERMEVENQKEEELWYNHGKEKTYFQVPNLSTGKKHRRNS